MNDEKLKTLLRSNTAEAHVRPAPEFWAEFMEKAADVRQDLSGACRFVDKRSLRLRRFYATLASAASLAACATFYFTVRANLDTPQSLKSFKLGEDFQNSGAVVITDKKTAATILWVFTGSNT